MRRMNLLPEIRKKRPTWISTTATYTAENIIDRRFKAASPNEKCFTDVSYLFYGNHEKPILAQS